MCVCGCRLGHFDRRVGDYTIGHKDLWLKLVYERDFVCGIAHKRIEVDSGKTEMF